MFVVDSSPSWQLICDMQGLEEDYQMNGENCEQLKSIRDGLVLAAEPADLMDAFRYWKIFLVIS